jgi:ABC-type transport system involved in cytochrome c biogenesis permease component
MNMKRLWTGRIMSGVAVLFLLFDSITKLMRVDAVMKAAANIGYPASTMVPIGLILLVCVVVYLIPRTAVLGAVLLTGYLGGAVATHVRVGDPLMSHVLFPIYFGVLIWGGLYLRDLRVHALIARRDPPR